MDLLERCSTSSFLKSFVSFIILTITLLQAGLAKLLGLAGETNVQVNFFFLSLEKFIIMVASCFLNSLMFSAQCKSVATFSGWSTKETGCTFQWSFCQGFDKQWTNSKFVISLFYLLSLMSIVSAKDSGRTHKWPKLDPPVHLKDWRGSDSFTKLVKYDTNYFQEFSWRTDTIWRGKGKISRHLFASKVERKPLVLSGISVVISLLS